MWQDVAEASHVAVDTALQSLPGFPAAHQLPKPIRLDKTGGFVYEDNVWLLAVSKTQQPDVGNRKRPWPGKSTADRTMFCQSWQLRLSTLSRAADDYLPALAATVSFCLWRQHWKHCGQNSTTCRCHWNSCFLRMSVVGRWSHVCAALLAKVLWLGVTSSFLILPRHVWPTKLQVCGWILGRCRGWSRTHGLLFCKASIVFMTWRWTQPTHWFCIASMERVQTLCSIE